MRFTFSDAKKQRVIVNTDAKNEADDQFAIVHALLTPSFDLCGIIPAHFGTRNRPDSLQASHDEVNLLLRLMELTEQVRVEPGASGALPDAQTPVDSPGARLILEEAFREDARPLSVLFYGPLTDMAAALLLEPRLAQRQVRVIRNRREDYPGGWPEYNLSNDIHAANVVFQSSLEVWQVPSSVYGKFAVSHAELYEKVFPQGKIGRYLVEQLVEYNARHAPGIEYRSLGDSPAVGVALYPDGGQWEAQPAPDFDAEGHTRPNPHNRLIRVYRSYDARFLLEDFFAKLAQFARHEAV